MIEIIYQSFVPRVYVGTAGGVRPNAKQGGITHLSKLFSAVKPYVLTETTVCRHAESRNQQAEKQGYKQAGRRSEPAARGYKAVQSSRFVLDRCYAGVQLPNNKFSAR